MSEYKADNGHNYVTVIPVDFPKESYPHDYPPGHIARDYVRERSREGYLKSKQLLQQQKHLAVYKNETSQFFPAQPPAGFEDDPTDHLTGKLIPETLNRISSESKETTSNKKRSYLAIYLKNNICMQLEIEDAFHCTAEQILTIIVHEQQLGLSSQAVYIFALWITSPHLEVQLKPFHNPLQLLLKWKELLKYHSKFDITELHHQPRLVMRRNVFLLLKDETKLNDSKILELLYEEAKDNVLRGRYPCEVSEYEILAGIQSRLELGPYDQTKHTVNFFQKNLHKYLPNHVWKYKWPSYFNWTQKSLLEERILIQFKAVNNLSNYRLIKKYLEFCWSLPYYGSAFFYGQIECYRKRLCNLFSTSDLPVFVAINSCGVYIIDPSIQYEHLCWDFAKPSREKDSGCLPCLFIQFPAPSYGKKFTHILQIFSTQALLMDTLISTMVELLKYSLPTFQQEEIDDPTLDIPEHEDLVPLTTIVRSGETDFGLTGSLQKLCLATFNEVGDCVNCMGSWAFSK